MTDLGTLGGAYSEGNAVNDSGEITGVSLTSGGTAHAFLYTNGQLTDLTPQATNFALGTSINAAGQVAGYMDLRAFLYTGGQTMNLPSLGNTYSLALGINNHGDVTGEVALAGTTTAFLYSNGQVSYLGYPTQYGSGINNSGQVTGQFSVPYGHAFLYSSGQLTDIGALGPSGASPFAINDAAQIAGTSGLNNGLFHAFVYADSQMLDLGVLPGGDTSEGYGINDQGEVVGRSATTTASGLGSEHAFLYMNGQMIDLNDVINSTPGFTLYDAKSISDTGLIVADGGGTFDTRHAFLLTPVPEPSTVILFGSGLLAIGVVVRHRLTRHSCRPQIRGRSRSRCAA
jgi:probable HAF family extracellular repeat protein